MARPGRLVEPAGPGTVKAAPVVATANRTPLRTSCGAPISPPSAPKHSQRTEPPVRSARRTARLNAARVAAASRKPNGTVAGTATSPTIRHSTATVAHESEVRNRAGTQPNAVNVVVKAVN